MLAALLVCSLAQRSYRQDFPLPGLVYGSGLGFSLGAKELAAAQEADLKAAGGRWVRLDFVATGAGFDASAADRRFGQVRRLGMRAVCRLEPSPGISAAAFASFAKTISIRYRRRGVVWEISAAPEAARQATSAIRASSPEEWIVGPGLSLDESSGLMAYGKDAVASWDAISVRPTGEATLQEYALLRRSIWNLVGKELPIVCTGWEGSSVGQYFSNMVAGVSLSIGPSWPPSEAEAWKLIGPRLRDWTYRKRMFLADGKTWSLIFTERAQPTVVRWNPAEPRAVPAVIGLAERDPAVDLALSLPTAPSAVLCQSPADVAKLVRSFAASLPTGGKLSLEWRMPLLGRRKQVFVQGSDEIEAFTRKLSEAFLRTDPATALRLTVTRPDGVSVASETLLVAGEPLTAALDPTERGLYLTVRGKAGTYTGMARVVVNGEEREVPVELAGPEARVFLAGVRPDSQLTLVLKEGARVVLLTETARFTYLALPELTASAGEVAPWQGEVDERIRGPVQQLSVNLSASNVVASLLPKSPILLPKGASGLVAWIHGDGSGALVSVGFAGAASVQTPVDWAGWRRLTFAVPSKAVGLEAALVVTSAKPGTAKIGFGGFQAEVPTDREE